VRRARGAAWLGAAAARAALALTDPSRPARADAADVVEISGEAFGTTWHVRLPRQAPGPPAREAAGAVQAVLAEVDRALSAWRADSELSRFNASGAGGWLPVSPATARVVARALAVHRASRGAFDPTVAPLVAAWGFGPAPARTRPPAEAAVRAARARLGAGAVSVREAPPALRKARPDVALDLSGLAKGFAVDMVTRRLEALGATRFLVEVGGELRARGAAPGGGPWPVGIERPVPGRREVGWTVGLADAALATSGLHRNRFFHEGRRHAHVLDPRTGRPVAHALASVSVVAREAVDADAWATALLVLGPEAGPELAEREGLAALFVAAGPDGLETRATPAFDRWRLAAAHGEE